MQHFTDTSSLIQTYNNTFEITIEELPYFNKKQGNYFEPIIFNDIPSKENIKAAINISDPLMKSIILFMPSVDLVRQKN